jgi:hypothetical protein
MIPDVFERLPHRIGCALEPVRTVGRLFGRENIYKSIAEYTKLIGILDVFVQRSRIELREHEYAVDAAVDAIGNRDVDQPVFTGNGYGRLAAGSC